MQALRTLHCPIQSPLLLCLCVLPYRVNAVTAHILDVSCFIGRTAPYDWEYLADDQEGFMCVETVDMLFWSGLYTHCAFEVVVPCNRK